MTSQQDYPPEAVHELIRRVYLAGADAKLWPEFLRALSRHIDAASAWLAFVDRNRGGCSVNACVGLSSEALRLYRERYAAMDPFLQGSAALGPLRPGFVGLAQELLTEQELARTEYFQEYGERYGSIGGFICVVYAEGPLAASLGGNRKPGRWFGDPEVRLLKTLVPHLRTAMQIHRKLVDQMQIGQAALATLNRMSSAAYICDDSAAVLHMNNRAVELSSNFVRSGRLTVPSRSETDRLHRAIADTAKGALDGSAADARVHLTSALDVPVSALVTPVPQQDVTQLIRPMVAVLVAAPSPPSTAAISTLAAMYGLSTSESRLAHALASGAALREAAQRASLSYETARTYLKRLFAKTGVRRQADLLRVLLTSLAD